jgi:LPPG:FO 2-phospho-L-lactate transferase
MRLPFFFEIQITLDLLWRHMKVVALAGGVGGAKLAEGLAQNLPPEDLTIIVNTGDDFEHFGLQICPDLDTVCYTLAGTANPATGWGRSDETWQALEVIGELGGPTWFRLGDRDLGLHLDRTRRLRSGQSLAQVTHHFCQVWGIGVRVLPMSNDKVPTWVYTDEGELPFQEYFVHRQCHPRVSGFLFQGVEQANPTPGVIEALEETDLVVICPSNPWVSVGPILALPGVKPTIKASGCPVVAVSPIIGGKAVKGPAAKMYLELGIEPSAFSVARHYGDLLSGFVFDWVDAGQADAVRALGIHPFTTQTIMNTARDRSRLSAETLAFGRQLLQGQS